MNTIALAAEKDCAGYGRSGTKTWQVTSLGTDEFLMEWRLYRHSRARIEGPGRGRGPHGGGYTSTGRVRSQ